MLRGITHRQFEEWRHYADLEPFDEERADARAASVVQAVLNTSPHRRKGSRAVELKDCLLQFAPPPAVAPARTAEEAAKQAAAVRHTMDMLIDSQGPKRKPGKRG